MWVYLRRTSKRSFFENNPLKFDQNLPVADSTLVSLGCVDFPPSRLIYVWCFTPGGLSVKGLGGKNREFCLFVRFDK